jgi:hypothetical protein
MRVAPDMNRLPDPHALEMQPIATRIDVSYLAPTGAPDRSIAERFAGDSILGSQ